MTTVTRVLGTLLLALVTASASSEEANLLALGEGALPVVQPPSYSGWPAVNLLDSAPSSGWACESRRTANNVFVFEMAEPTTLTAFEFDTNGVDGDGRGAKDVTVEVSSAVAGGYQKVLTASLQDKKDGQRFTASGAAAGRFVRLTILSNHGDAEWTELMGFRGFGAKTSPPPIGGISGTYTTNWQDFHMRQQGTALSGCYEFDQGTFDGTVEGRVMKMTWVQSASRGPAVFVFAPDGKSFRGYWWHDTDKGRAIDGDWNGSRASDQVGSCPHWSGSVSGELRKDLAATGRARLYGILFDTDSSRLRSESLPTLDEVVRLLTAEAAWKITIEGHTDSVGTPAHNQTLSEQRALSVRGYLISKGIAATRLTSVGFGLTKPVADNATELGRAQNRRVELVRN
jgi:OOP family OmpA-OmpF porin